MAQYIEIGDYGRVSNSKEEEGASNLSGAVHPEEKIRRPRNSLTTADMRQRKGEMGGGVTSEPGGR